MPSNTQVYGNVQEQNGIAQGDYNSTDVHLRSDDVKRYLQGVRFPANKHDLIEHAVEHQAPSRIVDLLQQLSTPEFGSGNATKLTVYNSFDELSHDVDSIA